MKNTLAILTLVVIAFAAYLLLWPIPIKPVAWSLPERPELTGVYEKNNSLSALEIIELDGEGPEDLTVGPDGSYYAGVSDGRIIRFQLDNAAGASTFVNTGGRPLGLQFDQSGNLIVADAQRGLLSISPNRLVKVLTNAVGDSPLVFVDDLDIAADGTIWFSDATQRTDGDTMLEFMEGIPSGRLLSYDPRTQITQSHLEDLRFANGVAVGPDDAYVLVNETLGARVTRLWLTGPLSGTSDTFLDGLPGYPDNISFDGRQLFWLAIPMVRIAGFERLTDKPLLRAALMRLPVLGSPSIEPVAWVIAVDTDGVVRHNLQDWGGQFVAVTSVNAFGGDLLLGSIEMNAIGRIHAPE